MAQDARLALDRPHRSILSVLNTNTEGQSDNDSTTDDELNNGDVDEDGEVSSLVGISMGQAQTQMRSPTTPAAIKARALESSNDYFGAEAEVIDEAQLHQSSASSQQTSHDIQPVTARHVQSIPRPDDQSRATRRSTLGSSTIIDGLRRLIPELPSTSLFKLPAVPAPDRQQGPNAKYLPNSRATFAQPPRSDDSIVPKQQRTGYTSPTPWDGSDSDPAVNEADRRPRVLRRATSDNSLYLRSAVTGASAFDDYTAFSQIADRPNPRFKAITDSLQDTSMRMPRFSIMSFSSSHTESMQSVGQSARVDALVDTAVRINPQGKMSADLSYIKTPAFKNTNSRHPIFREALTRANGDLVIMGGYRGSVLRSADPPHQQLWVPVKVGLNLRKVDLEVGLTHEDEEEMEKSIIPSGILSHIGPIDISRRLLKKIQGAPTTKSGQLRLHDWGYDWRLSPKFLSHKLIRFLESLECNRPGVSPEKRGAMVIAHSLGGLITRYAANQRPELFSGIVYAGTPQRCCNILGPLRNGDDVLLSSRVLTAQVNFTLRTSYALLPEDGRCFLNKETGERYDIDFFNAETWEEYRLSPCMGPPLPIQMPKKKGIVGTISESISSFASSVTPKRSSWFGGEVDTSARDTVRDETTEASSNNESIAHKTSGKIRAPLDSATGHSLEPSMQPSTTNNNGNGNNLTSNRPSVATTVTIPHHLAVEYLSRTLTETKHFKQSLRHNPTMQSSNAYPPHAILFGKSMPTVYGAYVTSRAAIKYEDAYDDLAFAVGDGVVLASAAQLPAGYRYVRGGRVESDRGHVGLLGDLEGLGRCLLAVIDGREKGIGLGLRPGREVDEEKKP